MKPHQASYAIKLFFPKDRPDKRLAGCRMDHDEYLTGHAAQSDTESDIKRLDIRSIPTFRQHFI